MMSESKRFYLGNNDTTICDRSQGGSDGFNMLTIFKVVDLLNEQQSLINALKKENKELKEDLKKGFDVPIPYVENSMRRLRAEHKVGELQATIEQLEEEIERLNGLLFRTPKAIE